MHKHTCQCGHAWRHGPENLRNEAAHTCVVCGTVVWNIDHGDDDGHQRSQHYSPLGSNVVS